VAYQDHLSRLKYFEQYPTDPRPYHGIYNMGRNIGIRVNVPLSF
jgi:iron complex outermembrane receptor protein